MRRVEPADPDSRVSKIKQALQARPMPEGASWAMRRFAMEAAQTGLEIPEDVVREPVSLERPDGSTLAAEWIFVEGASSPDPKRAHAVLYLHGGGYCLGSTNTHAYLVQRLVRSSGVPALSVGYRLAPEHPFPAGLDDACLAYEHLLQDRPAQDTLVAGDSAGGGLALAMLLRRVEQAQPLPKAALLLSPWTDLTLSGDSINRLEPRDPMIARPGLERFAEAYLAGTPPQEPLVSPLLAEPNRLAQLPPLFIQVGSDEALLDDAERLAERAHHAGCKVQLEVWQDMIHVFQAFPSLREADRAFENLGDFARGMLVS